MPRHYPTMLRVALLLCLLPACLPSGVTDTSPGSASTGGDSSTGDTSGAESSSGHNGTTSGGTDAGSTGRAESSGGSSSGFMGTEGMGGTTGGGDATSTGMVTEGGGGTGEEVPSCWAKTCDANHPCAPGLECELHPDAIGLWVCSATCDACATGLLFCDSAIPLGECIAGPNDMRCFPVLCPNGQVDCKGGQECIDGACFG